MGSYKRDKIEIILDILKAIREKNNCIKPTHILYKANLSHSKFKIYIKELLNNGIIEKFYIKKNLYFRLTKKGEEYLDKINSMKKFMETFKI